MKTIFIAKSRALRKGLLLAGALFASCLLAPREAAAEIKLGEAGGWEAYSHGNIGVFLTHAFGDGYPVQPAMPDIDPLTGMPIERTIVKGGGVGSSNNSKIPNLDAEGNSIPGDQGKLRQWRLRTGFSPNIFGFGVRRQVTPDLRLRAHFSIWGSIETLAGQKVRRIDADFKEGYGAVDAPWGTLTIGRHQGLFSRGIVEMNFLYLHQYGVGSHGGDLYNSGPTAGMIGFGVLAAFFQPGFTYSSPKFGGIQVNVGVYDPVQITGSLEQSRTPRPEFEITWDTKSDSTFAKVFVNGTYQKLYKAAELEEEAMGVGYGGRLELGPIHFGAGGHYGKGLGLGYALEGGDTSVGQIDPGPGYEPFELRTFEGYSAFFQYAPGKFDINLGAGQSRVHLLESDIRGKQAKANSVVKTQTAVAAAFVYHLSERVHWDIDVLHAMYHWYKGEKQNVTFVNSGITLGW